MKKMLLVSVVVLAAIFPGVCHAQAIDLRDFEEETHATEHEENGADELLVENLGTACADGQIAKANATGGLACAADATGGGSALATQTDGTEQAADTTVYDWDTTDFTLVESPANDFDITIANSGIDHDATTNFVANEHVDHSAVSITAGAGLSGGGDLTATRNLAVASTEADFLTDGGVTSLTCGATNQGKAQVMDDGSLEYCDGAGTPALQAGFLDADGVDDDVPESGDFGNAEDLDATGAVSANSVALGIDTTGNYAAGDAEAGNALSGDSATAFFSSGEIEDARIVDALTLAGGTIGTSALTLVQSAAPTPTAEGVIEWETDDDHILVGDGVDQVEFVPTEDVSGDATMSTAGVLTIAGDAVALTTDTTGNYVASVANGTGITGGSAGSEGAALTLGFAYAATVGANPALNAGECIFGTTGIICEGSSGGADTIETLITVADPTSTDKTITLPNTTGTVVVTNSTNTVSTTMFTDDNLVYQDVDYTAETLATNPAFLVDECFLISTATGGGFICEGSSPNTNEQLYLFPDVDGADTTSRIVVDATEVTDVDGAGLAIATAALNVGAGTCLTVNADDVGVTADCIDDAQVVDGGLDSTSLGTDSVSADELNAAGVEAELEAVLDLADLQEKDIDSLTGQSDIDTAFTFDGVLVDLDGGTAEATLRLPNSATLPGTCSTGDTYWDTDADTNGSLYVCRATNDWKEVDDDGGAGGSGDAIEVEDGDDGGTFTAIDTTARFEDQGDINFTFADGGAGGPDTITATVRANSVALTTDTTGNYVASITNGSGITGGDGGSEGAALTLAATLGTNIDSAEIVDDTVDWPDINQGTTLAGNPAMLADECFFAKTAAGGGFICEGANANNNEQLYLFPDVDGADTSTIFVTNTTSVTSVTGAGLLAPLGTVNIGAGTCITVNADDVGVTADCISPTQVDETQNYVFTTVSGKQKRNTNSVSDDDCTGEQGSWWYDTTDSAFEFCDANSGAPATLGGGGGTLIQMFTGGFDGTNTADRYMPLMGIGSNNTQGAMRQVFHTAGVLRNMRCKDTQGNSHSDNPGWTITLMKNGSAQSMACSLNTANPNACTDLSNTNTISANDHAEWRAVKLGSGSLPASHITCAVEFHSS